MIIDNCELTVFVKGRSVTEYVHRDQTFIEGRGGSNYEIQFFNHNSFNVEVILSVDGLSVTDGKAAGPLSNGYVVQAGSQIQVPGWTLDNAQVAAFAFASAKGGSYVEQIGGADVNKGIIGALVYKEKVVPPSQPVWTSGIINSNIYSPNISTSGVGAGLNNPYSNSGMGTSNNTARNANFNMSETSLGTPFVGMAQVEQTLGTAFGKATTFITTPVFFQRGDMLSVLTIQYDDIRGLKARGINITPKAKQFAQPQAFPGMTGCPVPPGWKG
ncbi:unnamed protein product [Sphagnum tenellum]